MFDVLIKWTGSKRRQSEEIVRHFPKVIQTYYEPFVGGGSVFRQLIESRIKVERMICSDRNEELILLWETVKNDPDSLIAHYEQEWNELRQDIDYYYTIRSRFNEKRNPMDFFVLTRTSANGLIRYNAKGNFNSPVNRSRTGMKPSTVEKIMLDWHQAFKKVDIQFLCRSYDEMISEESDFMYVDPPYANISGVYQREGIHYSDFWSWLKKQKGSYALSFDGYTSDKNYVFQVPEDVYHRHIYIDNGISGFGKIHRKREYGKESLYLGGG